MGAPTNGELLDSGRTGMKVREVRGMIASRPSPGNRTSPGTPASTRSVLWRLLAAETDRGYAGREVRHQLHAPNLADSEKDLSCVLSAPAARRSSKGVSPITFRKQRCLIDGNQAPSLSTSACTLVRCSYLTSQLLTTCVKARSLTDAPCAIELSPTPAPWPGTDGSSRSRITY
jgi:hypothetical protein